MAIAKHAKLSEDTRILLNRARSRLLEKNPKIKKVTDDIVISTALKKFLRG